MSTDGGGNNVVRVTNDTDGCFRARGSIDFRRFKGSNVTPSNLAQPEASCKDCQSIAVAVQIGVYERGASHVAPKNGALAINTGCTRCVTVAYAVQYIIPVDDPKDAPKEIDELAKELDKEFKYFERIKDVTEVEPEEAEARVNRILEKYQSLLQYVNRLRDEKRDGEATPAPVATGTAAATAPVLTVTATPASTVRTPTSVATGTAVPSPRPVPSGTPRP